MTLVLAVVPSGFSMKFSCERCQTRYSIGDDKVRGKVLKIRCKTCGNIVVVREQLPTVQGEASGYATPQMAAAAGTGPSLSLSVSNSSPSSSSPPMARIDWYVAIKGKQHGPASGEDVVRLYREGQLTERSYLWHDRLPAWTRLKELPEFAWLVGEAQAPRRPPPPPPGDEPREGAEIVNFEAARAQRLQQQQREPAPAANLHDPFAAVGPADGTHDHAPRDSTRVFIMQAGLHNRGTKHKLYASIAAVVGVLFVGVCIADYQLDILGLKKAIDAVAVTTGIKEAPPPEDAPGWDDVASDPALKCRLRPDRETCIKEETAKLATRRGGKKPKGTGGASVSDDDLKGAFGSGSGGSGGEVGGVVAVNGDGFVTVGTGGPTQEDLDRLMKGGKGGPSGPKARVELPATIGSTIDADNARKVVQEGQGGVQLCVDTAMKMGDDIPGKVVFTLTIGLKGAVERAVANNAVVGASALGACLSSTMKKWKFAPPTEATDLDIPLILR